MTPPRLVLNAVPAAIVLAFVLVFAAGTTPLAGDDSKLAALLEKVTSDKVETRYAARSEAPAVGGSAVLPLAKLIASPPESVVDDRTRREISLTARAALERIVHHAGRPGAGAEARAVAAELAKLLDASQPGKVRREVLHWIALIGGDGEVPAVARSLDDADQHVRETARLALERIPGKSAVEALVEAARRQPEDRKADLLFSLGKKGDSSVAAFLAETASR
ncbi:MAG: HEAT repeat domain-containing protein, partial [Planctomycetes bacterium]|nr:HEAT repeat domain-containing protein [Planctomycetota bacterium]